MSSVGVTQELAPAPEPWWSARGAPEPLSAAEEASPVAARLTRLFNPSMAFKDPGVWPVDVRYSWQDGSDLTARVTDRGGAAEREYVAVRHADLMAGRWGNLPPRDGHGRRIRYSVDAPGDDGVAADGRTHWRHRWEALTGGKDVVPAESPFPPTQYAHVFWFNRKEGLLGIQYWFYYPFNEWVNHHEGDWEHINIILEGSSELTEEARFHPVGYQFSFHSWTLETDQVMHVGGPDPEEDHVAVFAGGHGRSLFWQGDVSGGSYPLPAVYPGVGGGPLPPSEDTREPARFIAANEFRVVTLPEPGRLDLAAHPELGWLKLSFYAGQDHVTGNPPLVDRLGGGGPPIQPGARSSWNLKKRPTQLWAHESQVHPRRIQLPGDWPLLAAPWLPRPSRLTLAH